MNKIILSHEHVTIDLSGVKKDDDCRMDDRSVAESEFSALARRGVYAVVDQTARGMGRNPLYSQSIADKCGIRLSHATGYYKEPFLPDECYDKSERELASIMITELVRGIEYTGIKADHIGEIGTSGDYIHDIERKVFCAASYAHAETGAPICTHSTLGRLGLEQTAIFKEHGVDLSKVVISHIDLSGDYQYMLRLLDTGVNIGFDTVGKENYMPDAKRVAWLVDLCRAGYSDQIVLSMDITRKSNCKPLGGIGYSFLPDEFLPQLTAAGLSEQCLTKLLESDAARIYGIH